MHTLHTVMPAVVAGLAPGVPRVGHGRAYARSVSDTSPARLTQAATGTWVGACRVLAGSSSWADRSLVRDGSFYPSRSLSAGQRLFHYASRLPLTEVATTFRFPPTPDVTKRWVASTPAGFTMDVRAWSLLCGAPTWPESLWADLQGHVRPPKREGAKLYRHHLPADVVQECWDRFTHALEPLAAAGRLGAVVFRFPSWLHPGPAAWGELVELSSRFPGWRVAVELSNERWFEGDACEQTLGLLEEIGLSFVCRDGPGPGRPIVAATSEVGFVRFTGAPAPGHGAGAGAAAPREAGPGPGEPPWSYRYTDAELTGWAPAIHELASCTREVHLIMDNCWRTNAVDNAAGLLELLARAEPGAGSDMQGRTCPVTPAGSHMTVPEAD